MLLGWSLLGLSVREENLYPSFEGESFSPGAAVFRAVNDIFALDYYFLFSTIVAVPASDAEKEQLESDRSRRASQCGALIPGLKVLFGTAGIMILAARPVSDSGLNLTQHTWWLTSILTSLLGSVLTRTLWTWHLCAEARAAAGRLLRLKRPLISHPPHSLYVAYQSDAKFLPSYAVFSVLWRTRSCAGCIGLRFLRSGKKTSHRRVRWPSCTDIQAP